MRGFTREREPLSKKYRGKKADLAAGSSSEQKNIVHWIEEKGAFRCEEGGAKGG